MLHAAFIGLGTMGYPMAGHLVRHGYHVTVFNRTLSKAEKWQNDYNGTLATTPSDAARHAAIIFICVGNDDDLRDVITGKNGIIHGATAGSIVVDHSTVSAQVAREMAALLATKNIHFIDAPVSGGQQGAEQGQLTIMCGAEPEIFARVEPILKSYAKAVTLMGPVGNGQLTKMVNQICVAGLVEALAEGMYFAEEAGLDVQTVINAISQGAASSWQMVNRHKTMITGHYEHGFAVDWMRKDLGICLAAAQQMGITLPVTRQVDSFYAQVQEMGGGRWDTSSLLARLKNE